MNVSSGFGCRRISSAIRYIVCMSSITCAVLAEDAIKAALNNYKIKKENKAAAAAASTN